MSCPGAFYVDMRNDRHEPLLSDELFKLEGWIFEHSFFSMLVGLTVLQFFFPKTVRAKLQHYFWVLFWICAVFALGIWELVEWMISASSRQICHFNPTMVPAFACTDWFGDTPTMVWGDMVQGSLSICFLICILRITDTMDWDERPLYYKTKRCVILIFSLLPQLLTMFYYKVDICKADVLTFEEILHTGSNLIPYGFWLSIIMFLMIIWFVFRPDDRLFCDPEKVDKMYMHICFLLIWTGIANSLWIYSTYIVTDIFFVVLALLYIANWRTFDEKEREINLSLINREIERKRREKLRIYKN